MNNKPCNTTTIPGWRRSQATMNQSHYYSKEGDWPFSIGENEDSGDAAVPPAQTTKSPAKKKSSSSSTSWETRIAELKHYKQHYGNVKVPKNDPIYKSLSMWCDNQRRQRKKRLEGKSSSLTLEREETLNQLGFWWGLCKGERVKTFDNRIAQLQKYKQTHDGKIPQPGTSTTARNTRNEETASLHDWIRYQIFRFRSGKLSKEREQLLRNLGVELEVKGYAEKWEDNYKQLAAYKEKFGDYHVIKRGKEYPDLVNWIKTQRNRHQRGELDEKRINSLSSIGFSWSTWDFYFDKLCEWKDANGGKFPDRRIKRDGDPDKDLKHFCERQRKNFKAWRNDTLVKKSNRSDERILKLLKIGFKFD